MSEYMTPQDFAGKIEWEGGITGALDYGLKSTRLDPDDPASTPLREAWAVLEAAWNEIQPAMRAVEDILEDLDDEGDEEDGASE